MTRTVLFVCENLCTNHLGIHSGQWEFFINWQLWQVRWWTSDFLLVFVVIPVKMGLAALGIDASAIIIVKLNCQACYAQDIHWWLQEIKDILDVNRMLLSTVIFPAPSSCAHVCCTIFSTTNCRNIVLVSPTRRTDENVLVIADVNVCTIVIYYRGWIGVKFDWLILKSLVKIQGGRMRMIGLFLFPFMLDTLWFPRHHNKSTFEEDNATYDISYSNQIEEQH